MKTSSWPAGLVFGGLAAAAAASGDVSSAKSLWYRRLKKPPFQPPPWAFGPVWSVLYPMIAYSGYRVWQHRDAPGRKGALGWWGLQMGLNALWSHLFFSRRKPTASLVNIGILFGSIALYANAARKVDRPAAWLMAPYFGWVGFASLLNEEIVRRNA